MKRAFKSAEKGQERDEKKAKYEKVKAFCGFLLQGLRVKNRYFVLKGKTQ